MVIEGRLTAADLFRFLAEGPKRLGMDLQFDRLIDARGVTAWDFTTYEAFDAAQMAPESPGIRRAIVCKQDVGVGLSNAFRAALEGRQGHGETRIFRTLEDAVRWLGISGTVSTENAGGWQALG